MNVASCLHPVTALMQFEVQTRPVFTHTMSYDTRPRHACALLGGLATSAARTSHLGERYEADSAGGSLLISHLMVGLLDTACLNQSDKVWLHTLTDRLRHTQCCR